MSNPKRIYVFNKIDEVKEGEFIIQIDEEQKYFNYLEYLKEKFDYLNPVFISAYKKIGLDELKERIVKELE